VSFTDGTVPVLQEHWRSVVRSPEGFRYPISAIPTRVLVADKDGKLIPQNHFSQTWARAVRRVGMPPGTRFHDLRHTYASALIAAGCSVKVSRRTSATRARQPRWTHTAICGPKTRTEPGPPSRPSSAVVCHQRVTTRRPA